MFRFRFVLPAVILGGFLAGTRSTYGNLKYTKVEKRPCVTCHVDIKTKELNAVGKCYKQKQTLVGCEPRPDK
jgi:hypothetical protein